MRLLIAENDARRAHALAHLLTMQNYLKDAVTSGSEALAYAETNEYDGLIFNISLPDLDGIRILEKLRAQNITTPALLLTEKNDPANCVAALDAGADDYLRLPTSTAELLARIRAMLRRKDSFLPDQLHVGALTLDRTTFSLLCHKAQQPLSCKEYHIMELLMQRPDTIISTDQLMTHVWGWESPASVSALWVHISNIRKKLQSLNAPITIRFIRSAGYILESTTPSSAKNQQQKMAPV